MSLPADPTAVAPDGSDVRVLLALRGGSMVQFVLAPGAVSSAVRHRTVEELWYVLSGSGELWRRQGSLEEVVALTRGVCVSIPVGTAFQFRSSGAAALEIVAVTMPPWPGANEAESVAGCPNW
jgi:mannose-6-phosphate isomerase-like protein (cupin superfamily)